MKTEKKHIDLRTIVPYINWKFFFHAWKIAGNYDGIETLCHCEACTAAWLQKFTPQERPKAEEALKLFKDAQACLRAMAQEQTVRISALWTFLPAKSEGNDIVISTPDGTVRLPTLRQQKPNERGECAALADFVSPIQDEIGFFALSVQDICKTTNDLYADLLRETIHNRLAEAAAEYLQKIILGNSGIRPAIGYPSLPDQSLIFEIDKILDLSQIGIRLTGNGAMEPLSSICGLYIKHPKAYYFMVGKISDEQLEAYARKRGKSTTEMRKWLAKHL